MKEWFKIIIGLIFLYLLNGCHSTKKLQTAIQRKDTVSVNMVNVNRTTSDSNSTVNTIKPAIAILDS
ncbi:MAG: hypothetical protein ABI261_07465, partial [Ginsengibacter sp.]